MRQPCLRVARAAVTALLLSALAPGARSAETGEGAPAGSPPTRRDDVRDVFHGVEIVDPYRWLEDGVAPETRAWIAAQDRYTRSVLEPLPLRAGVERRLSELLKIDQVSAPFERGGSYFFSKRAAGQALSVLYRRRGLDAPDEVILDPHGLSPDQTTSVGFRDVSTDGRLMAYAVREGGLDEVQIKVMDLATKRDLADRLPKGLYAGLSFNGDGKGFYYGRRSRETGTRILYHAVGTDPAKDVEVFGAGYGPATWIGAEVSDDGRWLLISVGHGWARDEVWVQDLANGGPPRPIVTDLEAHFNAGIAGDRLILHTDWQAPTYRLLSVDLEDPARERWREIVPAGRDVMDGFALIGGRLFVSSLHDVASRIGVFSLDGAPQGEVELPRPLPRRALPVPGPRHDPLPGTESNNPPALLEYGDARDPKQFEFLRAYSPYQKVAHGTRYPAVLLTSGDADTRVPPQQARKMAARLQAATTSGRPVLLLYDAKAGHSGGKPFDKVVADMALEVSFLLWQLGER